MSAAFMFGGEPIPTPYVLPEHRPPAPREPGKRADGTPWGDAVQDLSILSRQWTRKPDAHR